MTRYQKYNNGLYKDGLHRDLRTKVGKCLYCGELEQVKEVFRWTKDEYGDRNIKAVPYTNLNIHHIDGDKANYSLHNLTVLCQTCHITYGHIMIKRKGRIITLIPNKHMKFKTLADEFAKEKCYV
jgi:hypothetical protein